VLPEWPYFETPKISLAPKNRPIRWWLSWMAVVGQAAPYMLGQLGALAATRKWPPYPSAGKTLRGVDFYPWKDFVRALIQGGAMFKRIHGYLPPLAFPATFNEHIFVRKFFAPMPLPSLADKLAAKDYVKERVGEKFLPAVTWVGEDVGTLFAAKPPAGRYVLKPNHGSSWLIFLNLPDDLSAKRNEIEQQATRWLTSRYGYDWGEWPYSTFRPKLFLEEFVDFNGAQTPDDYKIFCFQGKASLIEINANRFTQLRSAFYTPDWKQIPVAYKHAPIQCARPDNLEEMIRVAQAIADGMDFARVDLYSDRKSRIRFGEITLTPGDARLSFADATLDLWLGGHFGTGPRNSAPWEF
jgi:TupA-like ATPgrasp